MGEEAISEVRRAQRVARLQADEHTAIAPLDDYDEYIVSFDSDMEVWIEGADWTSADMDDTVSLTPKQFLTLMEWGEQHKATLKRLAGEQVE